MVTVTLSLDATVVLLAPLAVATGSGPARSPDPRAYACLRMANSGSLLLPVANLTNLIALRQLHLTFVQFGRAMAPAWLAVLAVEYAGLRLLFRRELQRPADRAAATVPPLPAFPLAVVLLMLVAFVATSPSGVAPVWPAALAAATLAGWAMRRGMVRPPDLVAAATCPSPRWCCRSGWPSPHSPPAISIRWSRRCCPTARRTSPCW
jgi:arsenical pump membrane protein